jgi:hypothetical protein
LLFQPFTFFKGLYLRMREGVVKYGKIKIITAAICISVFLLVRCMDKTGDKTTSINRYEFKDFAGSQTCVNCHKEIYDSHLGTAHYLSSAIASLETVKGSFEKGSNTFQFNNGSLVSMEKRGDSLFQVEYINGRERRNHVIDIVIGSGAKGQSFLYWGGNKLYDLFYCSQSMEQQPGLSK